MTAFQATDVYGDTTDLVSESTKPKEMRFAKRCVTNTPAVVHQVGNRSTIQCTACDQSSTGAQLKVDSPNARDEFVDKDFGPQFWLYLPFDRTQVKCEVVWFSGQRFGVRFISQMHTMQPAGSSRRRSRT